MSVKKYTDWTGWLEGFYDSWIDSLTSTLIALGGTNAVGAAVPQLHLGLNLQQAGGIFLSVTFWSMVQYLKAHKRPNVITETFETTHVTKDPTTGQVTETGTSKVTTTTPTQPTGNP